MEKPIYKQATLWGVLGGTALAFLYLKTMGKGKGLDLTKTLLIGGGIGAVVGYTIDNINTKPKVFTEEELKQLASTISSSAEQEVDSYFQLLNLAKLSEQENQKVMKVIHAMLLARKDGKWDAKASIAQKKTILLSYGITLEDYMVFERVVISGFTNIIMGAFNKT